MFNTLGFFSRFFGEKEPQINNIFNLYTNPDIIDRHTIETDLLPHLILGNKGISVVKTIMKEKGDFFVKLYSSLHSDHRCLYSANDFSFKNFTIDKNRCIVEITMPKPEVSPLCEKLIIAIDCGIKVIRYTTVEKGFSGESFLCEWILDDRCSGGRHHSNYGDFSKSKLIKILGW